MLQTRGDGAWLGGPLWRGPGAFLARGSPAGPPLGLPRWRASPAQQPPRRGFRGIIHHATLGQLSVMSVLLPAPNSEGAAAVMDAQGGVRSPL